MMKASLLLLAVSALMLAAPNTIENQNAAPKHRSGIAGTYHIAKSICGPACAVPAATAFVAGKIAWEVGKRTYVGTEAAITYGRRKPAEVAREQSQNVVPTEAPVQSGMSPAERR